jgi:hypothetical protein
MRKLLSMLACAFTLCAILSSCDDEPAEPRGSTTPYVARDPADLVQKLAASYGRLDPALFDVLFPTAVNYFYFLNEPLPNGDTHWGLTEELRIHQRMFAPEETPPGEAPVPAYLRLSSISITLTPLAQFIERPDLYTPNGELDPMRWKAMQADYAASILFDTVTETDYRIEGIANFVVIEDLTLPAGSDSKFSIYRWEDLGTRAKIAVSWSSVKGLYR